MGCSPNDEVKNETIDRPIPEGSKKVDIVVEESFNLTKTTAYGNLDFFSMKEGNASLFVPSNFESAIFFMDENSGEVLAVVRTNPTSNNVKVNANSVSQALMNLVPSYHSLSRELQKKFEQDAPNVKLYMDFVAIVDMLLKEGKTVYSTDPEFLNRLVDLHNYINRIYFGVAESDNNASSSVARNYSRQGQTNLSFSNWMKRDGGGTLTNNVHSYVYVNFKTGGEEKFKILNPEHFFVATRFLFFSPDFTYPKLVFI